VKILEYEAKNILKDYNIPIPTGFTISSIDELNREKAYSLGFPLIVKAQVPVSGRGKAGGILKVNNFKELKLFASKLLKCTIKGIPVRKVLIEKFLEVIKEYYVAYTIDYSLRNIVFLASTEGGVDIEETIREKPYLLHKVPIDPYIGLKDYVVRNIAYKLGIPKNHVRSFTFIVRAMFNIFREFDAELVEVNPLALTDKGLYALDARIIIDENSLFRQKDKLLKYISREMFRGKTAKEEKAETLGLSYVELDGNVGVIGNGAGLTMATMDLIGLHGMRPACFLDIGGGASRVKVKEAVNILLENPKVKAIFMNIFGGITRCDEVALGIVEALKQAKLVKPLVVRIKGTRDKEARLILKQNNVEAYEDIEDALEKLRSLMVI